MKRYLLLIFIFVAFLNFPAGAQQKTTQSLKEIFLDAEYFLLNEDYEEALFAYNTILKKGYAENANINYRIGQCYLNVPGSKHLATGYLEKASKNVSNKYVEGYLKETKAPLEALFYLGTSYRINNQLDKAIEAYEKYKSLVSAKSGMPYKLAEKEIEACKFAGEMMLKPMNIDFTNLAAPVNTSAKDFFPAVSDDESMIVYNTSQKFYDAIMFSKKVDNKWSAPVNITPEVQSDGNQYVSSLSFDGNDIYLRQEDNFQANLLVSHYDNGKWSPSKVLNKNINTKFWEGNAFASKDGNTLYFSSNKKGGVGSLDLYKSVKQKDGEWGPPVNLGKNINTELNEDAPVLSEDGKRLYFVSQGHNTMGGYDIFYSDMDSDGKWKEPVNLGYPLNTTDDNLHFYPIKNGKIAYQAFYSKEGLGKEDIFRINTEPEMSESAIAAVGEVQDEVKPGTAVKRIEYPTDTIERVLPADVEKILMTTDTVENPSENVVMHAVFFDFNSAVLNETAIKEMDYIATVMKNYPELKLLFVGNTDGKGSAAYNNRLASKRTVAVKTYLVKKGIKPQNILVKAMGMQNFIAINSNADGSDNPDGRKFNRRVDVKIEKPFSKTIIIEQVKVPEQLQIK